jgi:hypothetical protein
LIGVGLLSACNFPAQPTPDRFATAAEATVAARLTEAVLLPSESPNLPTTPPPVEIPTAITPPSITPTITITPTLTTTQTPCNRASFITDVTVPDGETFSPNEAFTKTWRLKNTGSCDWTSSYSLVFDQGDSMGAAAAIQLTPGTVEPGETVDVSVNLTAPGSTGTYKGYWKLRDNAGVIFGIGPNADVAFWVEIEVAQPTAEVELLNSDPDSGSVRSDTSVLAVKNVGDTGSNLTSQGFVTFDISGIPADATITEVITDFTRFDTLGNPFGDLGCLDLYQDDYDDLDAGDYFGGVPSGRLIRWCSTGSLSELKIDDDMVAALQSKVGSDSFQLRLQFQVALTSDGEADMVRFAGPGKWLILTVRYTTP